jgi:UPF0755 protein
MHIKNYQKGMFGKLLIVLAVGIIIFVVAVRPFFSAPPDFPTPYHLRIEPGQTLFSISQELLNDHVIRSPRLFEIFMLTFGNEKRVSAGEYFFAEPMNALEVALRISGRQFGIDRRKVTFPEGYTNKEMSKRLQEVFPDFNTTLFLDLAYDEQGYLFPDTYGFFPSIEPDGVIAALRKNFDKKIAPLEDDIAKSKRSKSDIIIMASIIEKEANGEEDRGVVSGILWKRIDAGMPLQVDAPFLFILDKKSRELTRQDLETKSLYNTYLHKGLTPTPINNPGLASIEAAIHPIPSEYLYYLHDATGAIHYASTYAEHKKNIQLYLK